MYFYLPKFVVILLLIFTSFAGLFLLYASEYYASANYLRPNWAARAVYVVVVVGGLGGAAWLIFGG